MKVSILASPEVANSIAQEMRATFPKLETEIRPWPDGKGELQVEVYGVDTVCVGRSLSNVFFGGVHVSISLSTVFMISTFNS